MATIVWMAVFFLLMIELVITALLVLPLPRVLRKFIARKIFNYDLGRRIRFVSNFIILGLILAVSDAVQTLRHLEQKEGTEASSSAYNDALYLAGFALTLMFVIARIVELMQEVVNVEEQKEVVEQRLKDVGEIASTTTSVPATDITSKEESTTLRKRTPAASNADKHD
ncbi:hypothetical protein BWQ96_03858 [Gracilariopsis chorda]|uniref:Endoplasmic reticulum transmembrane protein n=1 Tax=Gracilariopsis chorda TaxID=448386 RepID=A0A2V3IW95_9FLOR|nr:hypothetical protein BWQ96_03858 [Gracilariopsis chorda]|eukprot:PXF46359.1 hypothetical protein BWQ96_03858 [Gracilariopsis chorda]